MALTSFDQIPEQLEKYCYVEFTMPITQVSHTTVRSVSICNSDSDQPPEKYVRQLARHEYKSVTQQSFLTFVKVLWVLSPQLHLQIYFGIERMAGWSK